jgi:hypothetical protein
MTFHVLADSLAGHFLHGPTFQFGATAQRLGFAVGQP